MSTVDELLGERWMERLKRVRKPAHFEAIGTFDVSALKDFVAALPDETWEVEDQKKFNDYPAFRVTRHIIARFFNNHFSPEVAMATPFWSRLEPHVAPVFEMARAHFNFRHPQYPKVMLAQLAAGGDIPRHRDFQANNYFVHKLHLPLITHESVRMEVAGEWRHLAEGTLYEINNTRPHQVTNPSDAARVHLIFEIFETPA